ncbi:MAG: citrate synthase [bacterium]|nr:citrate synthase [bacterium]
MDINTYSYSKVPLCLSNNYIAGDLYTKHGVKRGLRDEDGNGVLTGLTSISTIKAYNTDKNGKTPCHGELRYRGYDINDIVKHTIETGYGYEKTAYLLLFGELPGTKDTEEFKNILGQYQKLPPNFVRDYIMKAVSPDIMTSMTRNILALASYDPNPYSAELGNILRQCIFLIAVFPSLAVYCYQAYNHFKNNGSMYIHSPSPELSTAENILVMLRPDSLYSEIEARSLDLMLLLHMEQGGGNNSTFTTRVVTSTGSDTYSTIAAAMASLKGPRHGGACIRVKGMIDDIRRNVSNPLDKTELNAYLQKILDKQAYDKAGLIYGIGHPIYTLSDPRAKLLKQYAERLSVVKGRTDEFRLYESIEELAPALLYSNKKYTKPVSANIDFYSGLIYDMLDIPPTLYTPMSAVAMITGWCAHRIEELSGPAKIIHPAYMSIIPDRDFDSQSKL